MSSTSSPTELIASAVPSGVMRPRREIGKNSSAKPPLERKSAAGTAAVGREPTEADARLLALAGTTATATRPAVMNGAMTTGENFLR